MAANNHIEAGQKFFRLTVIEKTNVAGRPVVRCRCDCGEETLSRASNLISGRSKSCGCYRRENNKTLRVSHGKSSTATYSIWGNMIRRCTDANNPGFPGYGGRGITVCRRWQDSFEAFLSDMGERPSARHSIDRIDNSCGYEPGNCRWATQAEQSRNTRSNVNITFQGTTLCMFDWAAKIGLKPQTLARRLDIGWSIEDALTKPLRKQ